MRISDWSSDVCSSDLLPVRLRVLIPAVENSVSGNAFRPLDVLQTRKGVTVEVGNTDAEGRLVLRSEEHTSEHQSLMRISYAVFCLKKKKRLTNIFVNHFVYATYHSAYKLTFK